MKRMFNWALENPRDELCAILSSVMGAIHDMQDGIGDDDPRAQLRRMYSFLAQCQELAKSLPPGEWDKENDDNVQEG